MKIEIIVFKGSGKYYTSETVENEEDILMFRPEFKEFIRNNIPAKISDGYLVVKDMEDVDYNNQSFHYALYKYDDIFGMDGYIRD